jgi:predicted CXXCH cytochrome family protein
MSVVISIKKAAFLCTALMVICLSALESRAAVKTEECLECHDTYKNYLHGSMVCTDCHSSIASLPHPDRLPRPACATCHQKTSSTFSQDIHQKKGLQCAQCHNVHFLNKDRKYCVSCHGGVTHSSLPSEKKHLSLLPCIACHGRPDKTSLVVRVEISGKSEVSAAQIDRDGNRYITKAEWYAFDDLLRSSYGGASRVQTVFTAAGDSHTISDKPAPCAACHSPAGYFPTAVLQVTGPKSLTIPIDTTIFVPELPSQKEFARTVHGKNGIACTDCHKSQGRTLQGWSENATVCAKCHQRVEETYKATIHAKKGATHCVDCHNPHRIKSYKELNAEERVAVCSRCHKDYLRKHGWLPNTPLHFEYLECATCHSPKSEKSMVFYFARKMPGKKIPLSYDQLVTLFGSDPAALLKERQGIASPDTQIGELFATLVRADKNLVIDASIIVTRVYHDYSETRLKEKECVTCHSAEARFYDSMFFILPGKTSAQYVPVKGTLISTYPIGGFVDFFLLGEDKLRRSDVYAFFGKGTTADARHIPGLRFKLIDFIGLLLITLVVLGISIHIILRLVVKRR